MVKYAQTTTRNPEGAEGLVKYPRHKVSIVFIGDDLSYAQLSPGWSLSESEKYGLELLRLFETSETALKFLGSMA